MFPVMFESIAIATFITLAYFLWALADYNYVMDVMGYDEVTSKELLKTQYAITGVSLTTSAAVLLAIIYWFSWFDAFIILAIIYPVGHDLLRRVINHVGDMKWSMPSGFVNAVTVLLFTMGVLLSYY